MTVEIQLRINGKEHQSAVVRVRLLVHYLRDVLGLTGTHIGCETSICGACTVLLDGKAIKSCTLLAVQVSESEVTTIEGVSSMGPRAEMACIRCRRDSGKNMGCNAAFAHR